jgi:single-strand DNA-binding protein
MANLNKVMLIGRLTRDPECRTFSTGGKVAKFGFAVNNRKKNSQTGQWEEVPVFVECDAFNRGDFGKTADLVEQYLKKGSQCYIEGRLHLDQWDDKTTGQKRSMLKVVVDSVQFLETRADAQARTSRGGSSGNDYNGGSGDEGFDHGGAPSSQPEETIPF